jgi:phage/plasmid-like protein (TIGR03299 family)
VNELIKYQFKQVPSGVSDGKTTRGEFIMAHGFTENDTMFSVREKPWHGLGKIIQEAPNADEALKLAELDWEVIKCSVWAKSSLSEENAGFIPAINRQALVREDTNEVLGIVSKQYQVFQNFQMFSFADNLVGEDLRYETAGSIFGGKKVFATTKYKKEWKVGDDQIDLYLLLSNGHTGTDALKVAVTPVRVVCNNTLQLALSQANRIWSIDHFQTLEDKLEEARKTLYLTSHYMDKFVEFGDRMTDKKVSPAELENITETILFPTQRVISNVAKKYRDKRIDAFEKCYNAADLSQYRGTAWGVINAVSDYSFHRKQNPEQLMKRTMQSNIRMMDDVVHFVNVL